jgi:hypothetical protein
VKIPQLFVGRPLRKLFTITSDKGDSISFVQKSNDIGDDVRSESGFGGYEVRKVCHRKK